MSKKYDIVERLKAKNERPFICVAEDKAYSVDISKTTAIHIQALSKDETLDDNKRLDKIIEISLGEKAFKEIDEMKLSFPATQLLIEAIMSAISGEELAEVADRFPDKKE